jgi:prepilin-type N-terminal cleavage/methylation domain-containing protein
MQKNGRPGFTLPEILVTVTVVAVLAAVVVPAVTQYVTKGDAPASQQDIEQVRNAATAFTADTRKFPGALTQLTTAITTHDSSSSGAGFSATDSAAWKGPYLSATPTQAAGFTSQGLNLTISDTIRLKAGWLQDSIVAPNDCPGLLRLDSLLDKADGSGSGSVVWTGTCAQGTPNGTLTGRALRLTPTGG